MSKVTLSPEMADTIRELRNKNKIASKDIAATLKKSTSYVSKVENGLIKSIDEDILDKILEIILPNLNSPQERTEYLLQHQIQKTGSDATENILWFYNIDTVYRQIPISKELINEINDIMCSSGITTEQLVARINSNEEISEASASDDTLPYNEWIESTEPDTNMIIRMKLTQAEVDRILHGETTVCNYITIQAIVNYLFKFKMFPNSKMLTLDERREVVNAWQALLDKHKFFTMSRKEKLLSQVRSQNEEDLILNEFDLKNKETINLMLKYLKVMSDMDIVTTNTSLERFLSDAQWDPMFMLKLMGLHFSIVGDLSYTNKREMLREIKGIISKYSNLPPEKKAMDVYGDL